MKPRTPEQESRWERRLLDPSVLRAVARSEADAVEWFEQARWPHRIECLRCGDGAPYVVGRLTGTSAERSRFEHRREWCCEGCAHVFTVREGTFLEGDEAPLAAWCTAFEMVLESEAGASARELCERYGLDVETAGRLLHEAERVVHECHANGDPGAGPRPLFAAPPKSSSPPGVSAVPASHGAVAALRSGRGWVVYVVILALVCGATALGLYRLDDPGVIVDTWQDDQGIEHKIGTDRLPGESHADHLARHADRFSRFRGALADK